MVRREEQAWDPSASLILDSRVSAHAGRGMHNSIEWAISAAASVALHFLEDGFSVEIYEADGPLHISGSSGQHSSTSAELSGKVPSESAGNVPGGAPPGPGASPEAVTAGSARPTRSPYDPRWPTRRSGTGSSP